MPENRPPQYPDRKRPPPPRRHRPGSKRPRTVFNLDDVTAIAPPESLTNPSPGMGESPDNRIAKSSVDPATPANETTSAAAAVVPRINEVPPAPSQTAPLHQKKNNDQNNIDAPKTTKPASAIGRNIATSPSKDDLEHISAEIDSMLRKDRGCESHLHNLRLQPGSDPRINEKCGITGEEIHRRLAEWLALFNSKDNKSIEKARKIRGNLECQHGIFCHYNFKRYRVDGKKKGRHRFDLEPVVCTTSPLHDYILQGHGEINGYCGFSEKSIHTLIAKRSKLIRDGNLEGSDLIKVALDKHRIRIHDKYRKYRVDGELVQFWSYQKSDGVSNQIDFLLTNDFERRRRSALHHYHLQPNSSPQINERCGFTEDKIHMKIAEWIGSNRKRDFQGHARDIERQLTENGIFFDKGLQRYRLDGKNVFPHVPMVNTKSPLHDYILEGRANINKHCHLSEESIHILIGRRLELLRKKATKSSDLITDVLRRNKILCHDAYRKYRVDGFAWGKNKFRPRSEENPHHGATANDSKLESEAFDEQSHNSPLLINDENEYSLEEWVMGKLDAMITTAERQEERYVMSYWEEKILMHQLSYNIERAIEKQEENESNSKTMGSKYLSGVNEEENNDYEPAIDGNVESDQRKEGAVSVENENLPKSKRFKPLSTLETGSENEKRKDNDEKTSENSANSVPVSRSESEPFACVNSSEDGTRECHRFSTKTNDHLNRGLTEKATSASSPAETCAGIDTTISKANERKKFSIRRALPKYIPQQSGNSFDDFSIRLFTPNEFDSRVIQPLIRKNPNFAFRVRVLNSFAGDKYSYNLEATLSNCESSTIQSWKRDWERLQTATEAFLNDKISQVNLRLLLKDEASLELEIVLSTLEPLGLSFSKPRPVTNGMPSIRDNQNHPGLWIKRILPGKGIAKTLGSHSFLQYGCAILAVNGSPVPDVRILQELLKRAKRKKPESTDPIQNSMTIKLCLSKHADLRAIPLSKLLQTYRLQRRDGKPIDPILYPGLSGQATTDAAFNPARSTSALHESLVPSAKRGRDSKSSERTLEGKDHGRDEKKSTNERGNKRNCPGAPSNSCDFVSKDDKAPIEKKYGTQKAYGEDRATHNDRETKNGSPNQSVTFASPNGDKARHEHTTASKSIASDIHPPPKDSAEKISTDDQDKSMNTSSRETAPAKNKLENRRNQNLQDSKMDDVEGASTTVTRTIPSKDNEVRAEIDELSKPTSDRKKNDEDIYRHDSTNPISAVPRESNVYGVAYLSDLSDDDSPASNKANNSSDAMTPNNKTCQMDESRKEASKNDSSYQHVVNSKKATSGLNHQEQAPPRGRNRAASSEISFEVVLDAMQPLGGYFLTDRGQNFKTKCILHSKYVRGQLARDVRLKVGTQITAVMVGEGMVTIYNHRDLLKHYCASKHHQKHLRLIAHNTPSCKQELQCISDSNWDSSGNWIGKATNGWAGGMSSREDKALNATIVSNQHNGSVVSPGGCLGSGKLVRNLDSVNERPPRPPVLGPSESHNSGQQRIDKGRRSRQGSFSSKDSGSNIVGSFSPTADKDAELRQTDLPGEEAFVDAIRNKSWKELIDVLEKGPDFSKEFVQQVLQRQYHYVDTKLKRLTPEFSEGEAENLEAKKKILKIYINSSFAIDKAISLRNWTKVVISIKYLHLFDAPSTDVQGRSKVISTQVRTRSPEAALGYLSVKPKTSRVSYELNEFSTHNNYTLSLDNRKLVIEISEGDPKFDQITPQKLGEFVFTLNDLEKQCSSDKKWKDIERRSESLGVIGFRVKRLSIDKDYVVTKRQQALGVLGTQVDTVERFNKEYICSGPFKLTSNIRGINGNTLLYAAVDIMADPPLIEKILTLGGDPMKASGQQSRTPLGLAQLRYDRCRAKETDASNSGKPDTLEAAKQISARAKQLLELLEKR